VSDVPSEERERLARDLAEELRKLRVEDVLVNTLMHVSSIGYRRLGATGDTGEERDLDQVRLAIETMRALTPVLERFVPGELVRDFNSSVANLQLAYAKAASEAGAPAADAPSAREAKPSDESGEAAPASRAAGRDAGEEDGTPASEASADQTPGSGDAGQEDEHTPE
jgi:hypothetical protein